MCIRVDRQNVSFERFVIGKKKNIADLKIIHLSDLHFPRIKVDLDKLSAGISAEKPDLIFISGDLVNRKSNSSKWGINRFIERFIEIAPVFYVNGNHETGHVDCKKLYEYLKFD